MTDQPQQPYGQPVQQPYGQPGAPGQPIAPGQPGQPGQPESKFGTAAYDAGAVGQPMAEPKKWGLLKTLTLVSLGIYVVSGLVGLFTAVNEDLLREQTQASLEAQGLAASEAMIDQGIQMGMVVALVTVAVSLVIGIALYLVVFFGLRTGKNWARILGTVLAAIGTLYMVVGLLGIGLTIAVAPALGIVNLILSIAFIAVGIFWIVTAFSKENNAYVRSRS